MIYQVAIKSLPQDWLWCETWCDDDSKQRAKTIDLVSVCAVVCMPADVNMFQYNNFSDRWNGTPMAPCCSVCYVLFCLLRLAKYRAVSGASGTTPRFKESLRGLPGLRISPCSWLCFIPVSSEARDVWGKVQSRCKLPGALSPCSHTGQA